MTRSTKLTVYVESHKGFLLHWLILHYKQTGLRRLSRHISIETDTRIPFLITD